jgi:hypothetical protein
MKFRPQRGGLETSMRELFECKTWTEMSDHIRKIEPELTGAIVIAPYGEWYWPDTRIGWAETYIVAVEYKPGGLRVPVGFMDCNGQSPDGF